MFSKDRFRRFGKGCCRFKNWMRGKTDHGSMEEEDCRKKCKSIQKCFAFDLSTNSTNPSTYECRTYTGNGINFRTMKCGSNNEVCYADFSKIDIRGKKA